MRTYTQLTHEQRYQHSALLKMGQNQTEIVKVIGAHKLTISRELRRNRGQRGYRPKQAHQISLIIRKKAKPRIQEATWALIDSKLQEAWSLEQNSDWLNRNTGIQVSHERILDTFWLTNALAVICTNICAAKRSAVNAMAAMTVDGNYPIG